MQTTEEQSLYSDKEVERLQRQARRLNITVEELQYLATLDEADKINDKEGKNNGSTPTHTS